MLDRGLLILILFPALVAAAGVGAWTPAYENFRDGDGVQDFYRPLARGSTGIAWWDGLLYYLDWVDLGFGECVHVLRAVNPADGSPVAPDDPQEVEDIYPSPDFNYAAYYIGFAEAEDGWFLLGMSDSTHHGRDLDFRHLNDTVETLTRLDYDAHIRDMAWDGEHLWVATPSYIRRLDPGDWSESGWIPAPAGRIYDHLYDRYHYCADDIVALTAGGGMLYVAGPQCLWELDPAAVCEEPFPDFTGVCRVDSVNLRSGPGTDFEKLGVVKLHEPVYVLEARGDWWLVYNARGEVGWTAAVCEGETFLEEFEWYPFDE